MRRFLSIFFSIFLCVTLALTAFPVYAGSFSDTDSHWSRDYVEKAAGWDIVTGYTDGSFRPDREVTCQEAMIMICKTLAVAGIEPLDSSFTGNWTDALDRLRFADWAAPFAAQLLQHGYALEKDFLYTYASDAAQRQLIGAWFARALKLPQAPVCPESFFSDSNIVRTAFVGEIDALKRFGIMNGYTDGSLRPLGPVTRAELATMCVKSLQVLEDMGYSGGKERLKDTLFLAYGTIDVTNNSIREVKITESGKASLYRIPENVTILIDGVKGDFQSLSSLAGKNLAISCLYGFDSQLIIQTHSAVEKGTLTAVTNGGDFSLLSVTLSGGLSVSYVVETGSMPADLAAGAQISFISEGAHILELENTYSER